MYKQQHQADCMEIYSRMFDLYRSNSDLKMLIQFAVGDKFKLNNCMADSLDKSVVISPDGKLHRCEHLPGNDKSWGNIRDGVTDQALLDQMMQPAQVNEKCRSCAYLPICTPLYKSYCPGCFDNSADENHVLPQKADTSRKFSRVIHFTHHCLKI